MNNTHQALESRYRDLMTRLAGLLPELQALCEELVDSCEAAGCDDMDWQSKAADAKIALLSAGLCIAALPAWGPQAPEAP